MELDALLAAGVERGASDIHLKPGASPILRVDGRLAPQPDLGVVTPEFMDVIACRILPGRLYAQLRDGREVDAGYGVPHVGRFRVNMFLALGVMRAVLRTIPSKKPEFETRVQLWLRRDPMRTTSTSHSRRARRTAR